MVIIDVQNLTFAYNKKPVLHDISFSLEKGEFLGVIGPNGSGKSTLLRNLDGILSPKNGAIYIEGCDQNDMSRLDIAKIIGYIPQKEGDMFPITVFETVLLGRTPHIKWMETKEDKTIVARMLEKLGLGKFAMRDINQLSGGERQKVYIARALVQQPKLLLLDEPTANLDLKHQIEVLDLLLETKKKGVAIIIAIHDLNLALRYCDKFVILHQGQVFVRGGEEIINKKNIETVYGVKVEVLEKAGQKYVIPFEPLDKKDQKSDSNIPLEEQIISKI
ncbi:MAG: ABC transporter ATP-binding protein [Promethearchaeati archaeon]